MSSGIYKTDISDYVEGLKEKKEQIGLDGAVNFNSFELKEQHAILWIYQTKAAQGELKAPLEDKIAGIEETANLYRAQKCAFQDVLSKEGFEPTQDVFKTYGGRIAMLTEHGTFIILGKLKNKGRLVTMSRIHSPKYNHDKDRGFLRKDLKLEHSPVIHMTSENGYIGSPLRALAINPHGSDDDELEEHDSNKTVYMMGLKTAYFLTQPREPVKEVIEIPKEEPVKETPKEEPAIK